MRGQAGAGEKWGRGRFLLYVCTHVVVMNERIHWNRRQAQTDIVVGVQAHGSWNCAIGRETRVHRGVVLLTQTLECCNREGYTDHDVMLHRHRLWSDATKTDHGVMLHIHKPWSDATDIDTDHGVMLQRQTME